MFQLTVEQFYFFSERRGYFFPNWICQFVTHMHSFQVTQLLKRRRLPQWAIILKRARRKNLHILACDRRRCELFMQWRNQSSDRIIQWVNHTDMKTLQNSRVIFQGFCLSHTVVTLNIGKNRPVPKIDPKSDAAEWSTLFAHHENIPI